MKSNGQARCIGHSVCFWANSHVELIHHDSFGFQREPTFTTLLFIVPLGLLASVVPLTIFGAGAREIALISLLIRYGSVDEATAVGVSTAYLGCLWFLGLSGWGVSCTDPRQRVLG